MDYFSFFKRIWDILKKPSVAFAIRIVVSGLLLAYFLNISTLSEIVLAFGRIKPVYLLSFFLLYFFSVSVQTIRWKYLLRSWGVEQRYSNLFRSIMIGLFVNNFLPSSLGGDVYRLYAGGRDTGKVEAVAATIYYERIMSYASLVTLGLLVLSIRADFARDWLFWLLLGGALIALIILSSITSIPAFEKLGQNLSNQFSFFEKVRIIDWFHNFRFRVRSLKIMLVLLLFSFLIQFMDVFSFHIIASAIQIPITLQDLLLFVPLLYLAILVPITFNGLGVRETVFVMFSSSWGITSADAVAFSLTVFTLTLAGSLVGGLFYWFDRPMLPNEKTQLESIR